MRCAIYARVSTVDRQEVANQIEQLRRYAGAAGRIAGSPHGWDVVEFIDHESGKHDRRPRFQELFQAAARRDFDVVLVWALDRFSREGVARTFGHIQKLTSYGVQFESFTEPHFRTSGPAGELLVAITAWIAEQERIRIVARVKAGLDRARSNGTKLGRPQRVFNRRKAVVLRAAGWTFRRIARELGVHEATVRRVCRGKQITDMPQESRRA